MKIAVDGMGGDKAPGVVVEGAVNAAREFGKEIILVGDEYILGRELEKYKGVPSGISVHHAPTAVEMHEPATVSIRKKKDYSRKDFYN